VVLGKSRHDALGRGQEAAGVTDHQVEAALGRSRAAPRPRPPTARLGKSVSQPAVFSLHQTLVADGVPALSLIEAGNSIAALLHRGAGRPGREGETGEGGQHDAAQVGR